MDVKLEDFAVRIAALSGLRWNELDTAGQAHYLRLAERQVAERKRWNDEHPYQPKLILPAVED